MEFTLHQIQFMSFSKRLMALRKKHSLSQQKMADAVGIHVTQIKRYESGETQPSLDVLRKIALELNVGADQLLFDEDERGPGEELTLQLEAVRQFPEHEQAVIREVLEGLIIKYQTKRWNAKTGS